MRNLVGDIGGTTARLAFSEDGSLKNREEYQCKKYSHFEDIVKTYTQKYPETINAACFAIAGPVIENTVRTTNLPWVITAQNLQKMLNVPVKLINDFQANGFGIRKLTEKEIITISEGKQKKGPIAVIGAGTGLGQSYFVMCNGEKCSLSTEGGHVDFAPVTEQEIKLLIFLRKKYGRVSYERVLSGQGISNIYEFLTHRKKEPQAVVELAAKNDEKGKETLKIFSKVFGSQAGNSVLNLNAYGGVFMTGRIARGVIPKYKNEFMKSFLNKGRFKPIMQDVPVKIANSPDVGLLGAAVCLEEKLN